MAMVWKEWVRWAGPASVVIWLVALAVFGARLPFYDQMRHPVSLLGATGVPGAGTFNALGFVLPGLLADAIARVDGLRAHAEEAPEHLEGWHDVRKAAKAVRYCAEALVDAFGEPAAEIASAWEAVTEAFGEVQDTVVSAEVLGRHAWAAELAGEPVRPYTLLVEGELDRRLVALRRGVEALDYALEMGAKLPDVTAARSAGASST